MSRNLIKVPVDIKLSVSTMMEKINDPGDDGLVLVGHQEVLLTLDINGELEAAEIPSAATGLTVVVHGFEMSADGRPDPVEPTHWLKLILGAEAVCNTLIESDQDLQERLEELARAAFKRNRKIQSDAGEPTPAGG